MLLIKSAFILKKKVIYLTNHKLGATQVGAVLFFLTRCSFSLFGYQFLFQNAGNDAILAFLIASGLAIFLFSLLLKWRKKKNVICQMHSRLLKMISFLTLLFLFLFYLKETTALIQLEFIDISWIFIYFSFLFIAFLLSKNKLLSLSSSAFLLLFPFLFFFIILFLGGIPLVNLDYLKPFLLSPSTHFLKTTFFMFLFLLPGMFFLSFLPIDRIDHKEKQEKILFSYFILGCLSILLEIFLMHLTLGANLTAIYPYPLFALTSRISSFLIFDRIYFLFSFYLLFDSTIFLSILFLGMRLVLKEIKEK